MNLSSRDSNETIHGSATSTCESVLEENFAYQSLDDYDDHEEEHVQMKSISLKEYKILMNLIPEKEKLRNTIRELTSVIESKDLQLKEQQRERANYINVSHMSEVSILSALQSQYRG